MTMMTSKNASDNIIADMNFYENIASKQTQLLVDTMNKAMVGESNEEKTLELVETVAATLGDIMARLHVVEMALAQGQGQICKEQNRVPEIYDTDVVGERIDSRVQHFSAVSLTETGLPDSVTLLSDSLAKLDNFYYTEIGKNNYEYNWTGKGISTNIEFLVSRRTAKELRIRIVSTLKEDAFQNLYIEIDGNSVPCELLFDGELKYISVNLPIDEHKSDATLLSIVYADSCTPISLGKSNDNRCIGIAINSICVS